MKIENPNGYLSVSNEYGCSYSYLLNLGVGEVNFQLTNNGKTIDGATLGDATNGKIASKRLIIENKSMVNGMKLSMILEMVLLQLDY